MQTTSSMQTTSTQDSERREMAGTLTGIARLDAATIHSSRSPLQRASSARARRTLSRRAVAPPTDDDSRIYDEDAPDADRAARDDETKRIAANVCQMVSCEQLQSSKNSSLPRHLLELPIRPLRPMTPAFVLGCWACGHHLHQLSSTRLHLRCFQKCSSSACCNIRD